MGHPEVIQAVDATLVEHIVATGLEKTWCGLAVVRNRGDLFCLEDGSRVAPGDHALSGGLPTCGECARRENRWNQPRGM